MAKMIGDLLREKTGYQDTHRAVKNDEDRAWKAETIAEIEDPPHADGLCKNYKTGMLGCEWCYPDDDFGDGWFGDLEGRDGMLYNGKPVIDPWEGYFGS